MSPFVRPRRKCRQCAAEFGPPGRCVRFPKNGGHFCSRKCAAAAQVKARVKKSCVVCGGVFYVRRSSAARSVTCGPKCKAQRCTGSGNPNWRGGSRLAHKNRPRRGYRAWLRAVRARDGNRCVKCGNEHGPFEVDHIKPWRYFPDFRHLVMNGRVLCLRCHRGLRKDVSKWKNVLRGGREYVAVDLDGTLVEAPHSEAPPGRVSQTGRRLLEEIKRAGYKAVLYTGRLREEMTAAQRFHALHELEAWVTDNELDDFVAGVWPHPKPHVLAFVDDRAVRFRGDVDLALVEARTSCDYVDRLPKRTP